MRLLESKATDSLDLLNLLSDMPVITRSELKRFLNQSAGASDPDWVDADDSGVGSNVSAATPPKFLEPNERVDLRSAKSISESQLREVLADPNAIDKIYGRPVPQGQKRSRAVQSVSETMALPELTPEDLGGQLQSFAVLNNPDFKTQLETIKQRFPLGADQVRVEGNNILVDVAQPGGRRETKILNSPGFSLNDVDLLPVATIQVLAAIASGGAGAALTQPIKRKLIKRGLQFGLRFSSELGSGVVADEVISNLAAQGEPGIGLETFDERLFEQYIGEVGTRALSFGAALPGVATRGLRNFASKFRGQQQMVAAAAVERLNATAGAPPPGSKGLLDNFLGTGDSQPTKSALPRDLGRIESGAGETFNRSEMAIIEGTSARLPTVLSGTGSKEREATSARILRRARENVSPASTRSAAEAGADAGREIASVGQELQSDVLTQARNVENAAQRETLNLLSASASPNVMNLGKDQAADSLRRMFTQRNKEIKATNAQNYRRVDELLDEIVGENAEFVEPRISSFESPPNLTGKVDVSGIIALSKKLERSLPVDKFGKSVTLDDIDALVTKNLANLSPRQTLMQLRALGGLIRGKSNEIAAITGSKSENALSRLQNAVSEAMDGLVEEVVTKGKKGTAQNTLDTFKLAHRTAKEHFKATRKLVADQDLATLFAKSDGSFNKGSSDLIDTLAREPDKFKAALNLMSREGDRRNLKGFVLSSLTQKSKYDVTTNYGNPVKFINSINSLPTGTKEELFSPETIKAFQSMSKALEGKDDILALPPGFAMDLDAVGRLVSDTPPGKLADNIGKLIKAKQNQARNFSNDIMKQFKAGDTAVADAIRADDFVYKLIPNSKNAQDLADFMSIIDKRNPQLATDIRSLIFERTFTTAQGAVEDQALGIAKKASTGLSESKLSSLPNTAELPSAEDLRQSLGALGGLDRMKAVLTPKQFNVFNDTLVFLTNREQIRERAGANVGQMAERSMSIKLLTRFKGGLDSMRIKLLGRLFGDPDFVRFLTKAEEKSDDALMAALRVFAEPILRQSIAKFMANSTRQVGSLVEQETIEAAQDAASQSLVNLLGAPGPGSVNLLSDINQEGN